jgi:murein DD-endopeptidase MepM/ murein hydrolase activator NlpD
VTTNSRGPDDTPAPSGNVNVAPAGGEEVAPPPAPPPPPATVITSGVNTPPPAPTSQMPVLASTIEGLNVRNGPNTNTIVLQQLHLHETVALLEPLDQAIAKINKGKDSGEFINILTNAGNRGYVAAWLVERSTALTKGDIDDYINGIPDEFPIASQVDQMRALQDQLGLPDPFDVLPVETRTDGALVNLMINGFGPNTFSSQHWPNYYSGTAGMHNGFDYIIPSGTPLYALSDGVIIKDWIFMGSPFERTVTLWCFLPERFKDSQGRRMMSNVLVAYAHTSDNSLKNQFDVVKAGDQIAISGVPRDRDRTTGKLVLETNNAHLHMEVHLLTGDNQLVRPSQRQLLTAYKHAQPFSNQTPWNPMLFFSKRLARYHLHQGKTIGYFGQPSYPTAGTLQSIGAGYLPALDFFTLGYYEYGSGVVWKRPATGVWPRGVVTIDQLPARLQAFTPFVPYEATF